jgi:hypothetical protein
MSNFASIHAIDLVFLRGRLAEAVGGRVRIKVAEAVQVE